MVEVQVRGWKGNVEALVLGWSELPKVTDAAGCVFMVNELTTVRVGEAITITAASVEQFAWRLGLALRTGHFTGKLSPIVVIPLAKDRMAMAAYVRSPKTREELNALLGEEWFVEEGSIGAKL